MPIMVKWANAEQTILLETFVGTWTLDEYCQMVDQAAALLATKAHIVHIICDFTSSQGIPGNAVAGIRYANEKLPRNQGGVVFINPGLVVKSFVNIARNIKLEAAREVRVSDSLESAMALLQAEPPGA
ncbi:MAG: hypothetical protein JNJ61_20830 [Anaerolineae bacterium]|nr:hypothetical protein [Anaerolineae bacterium]